MSLEISSIAIRTSPHLHSRATVESIMRNVVYSLLPISFFAVFLFGISAFALIATTTLSCVLTEHLVCRFSAKETTIGDWSAAITGILLALTLPPGFPLWMAVVGSVAAMVLGKLVFGGLGYNVFNPALVGRAFLQAAFPVAITTWTPAGASGRFLEWIPSSLAMPFTTPAETGEWALAAAVDGFSGATPLALHKFDGISTEVLPLINGMTAGSAGETSAVIVTLCAGYLIYRGMMDWRIPLSMLLTAFVCSGAFYGLDPARFPTPFFTLFSGGMLLGAFFMATDMVSSPVTPLGVWVYGALMGVLTVIIRLFGGLPEGVMYAILLGNAASPLIEQVCQPKIYGARSEKKEPNT